MTKQFKITGIAEIVDQTIREYAEKKFDNLSKYLPRQAKKNTTGEIKFKEVNHDHGEKYEVEMILNVPGKIITAKYASDNMMSAIDEVDSKIKAQLKTYKASKMTHNERQSIISRFKRRIKRQI